MNVSLAMMVLLPVLTETVYVESPTDSDSDGLPDRIYVTISRPNVDRKLSTLYSISPYTLGGNQGPMHDVNLDLLPQEKSILQFKTLNDYSKVKIASPLYAEVDAHSLGTGYSTGCASVGDMSETLAAKSVIDWLNGKARAFYKDGREARADWANGNVGMTGISYDGTLPIMVATTGVEGLKAIVPIAAISNWYNYYRSYGLVTNPGGYVGEDADVLGYYIMKKGSCPSQLENITKSMGRKHGDFTPFWSARDYTSKIKNIKAATFIIHGQSDWNVKQKHAIDLWEGLEGIAPRRMFLHRGGHSSTSRHEVPEKIRAWFDHFLEGEENGITDGPQVEVELPGGELITQESWPHEDAVTRRIRLHSEKQILITDMGRSTKLESLLEKPEDFHRGRFVHLTETFSNDVLLTGTPKVSLALSVLNRKSANITVALVAYSSNGKGKIITRGWADPQNHQDLTEGEMLIPGKKYQLSFTLEPKQYRLLKGERLGVLVTSTDYDFTLRPKEGTEIEIYPGNESYVDLKLVE